MLLWSKEFWAVQDYEFNHLVNGNQEIFLTSHADTLKSGFIGPFGGTMPEFEKIDCRPLEEILLDAIRLARERADSYLEIRLPPRDFYPHFLEIKESVLLKLGFRLKHLDINSSLEVSNFSEINLNRNRKRDLKFWRNTDALYSNKKASLDSIYNCILENRKVRKIHPALNLNQMNKLAQSLGSRFTMHSVEFEHRVICAAVVLQLDQDIQYVFMWGDDPIARSLYPSPLTFLLEGMTSSFTLNSPVRLCLGTSSILGEVDSSLLRFKESLGFQNSLKPTYIIAI